MKNVSHVFLYKCIVLLFSLESMIHLELFKFCVWCEVGVIFFPFGYPITPTPLIEKTSLPPSLTLELQWTFVANQVNQMWTFVVNQVNQMWGSVSGFICVSARNPTFISLMSWHSTQDHVRIIIIILKKPWCWKDIENCWVCIFLNAEDCIRDTE